MRRALFGSIAVCASALAFAQPAAAIDRTNTDELQELVTPGGIIRHARALQDIALRNGGNRASATPGYTASINYVVGKLRDAGYKVRLSPFDFAKWTQNAPPTIEQSTPTARNWVEGEENFLTAEGSAGGAVTARVIATTDLVHPAPGGPGSSTSGCEASDFPAEVKGNIVLMLRGTCTFTDKFANAAAAGALGAIVMNDGFPGRTAAAVIGAPPNTPLLAISASSAMGDNFLADIKAGKAVTLRLAVDASTIKTTEYNVIADTKTGDPKRTVIVGSHLDGDKGSAGMNDNGSGVSAVLEIAEAIAERGINPRNRLRFAFWGAEEDGLVGSTAYVAQAKASDEIEDFEANLNFDMLGSTNFVRMVYDGDGSTFALPSTGAPTGSAQIEDVFVRHFREQGLMTDAKAYDGRSDYGPFIENSVPAGGLSSGVDTVKNARQESDYGGVTGLALDPCYHQACDNYFNLSRTALDQLSDGAAHAAWTLARSESPITKWQSSQPAKAAKAARKKQAKRSRKPMAYRGPLTVR